MKKYIAAISAILIICFIFPADSFCAELNVSAESCVLMCADNGDMIFEKNSCERMPMASITKIMTCIVVLEKCDTSEIVKVSEKAAGKEGSSLYLKANDTVSVEDLLYALMLRSANDAASALAYHVSGSEEEFAKLMNEKAEALGLSDTHFTNPHGLPDENHYTSAHDFALLTRYALNNASFKKIVGTTSYNVTINGGNEIKPVSNHNKMLRMYDGVIGVKTGFTKTSGRCLVTAAERDGVSLIAVTLNAPDDWADHKALLDYGFSEYTSMKVIKKGQIRYRFNVCGGLEAEAVNTDEMTLVLPQSSEISYRINAGRLVFSPVAKDSPVGEAVILVDGKEAGRVSLYATDNVSLPEEKSFIEKLFDTKD